MPRVRMTINAAEMLLREQPSRSDPALDHVGVAPTRDVVRAALDAALRAFDDVGGGQALVRHAGICSRCKVNISFIPSRNLRAADA